MSTAHGQEPGFDQELASSLGADDCGMKSYSFVTLKTDPAIAAGVFDIEVLPWYGAAALGTYLETQKKITKTNP